MYDQWTMAIKNIYVSTCHPAGKSDPIFQRMAQGLTLLQVISVIICLIGLSVLVIGSYTSLQHQCKETDKTSVHNESITRNLTVVITEPSNTSYSMSAADINSTHGLKMKQNTFEHQRKIHTSELYQLLLGLMLSCISGLGEAGSMVALKIIQEELDSIHVLTFWFTFTGSCASVVGMILIEHAVLAFPTDIQNGLYLLAHLTTSPCGLLCYIIAMGKLSGHITSIVHTSQIPVNVLLQYVFFKHLQPMDDGLFDLVGAGMVTVGLAIPPIMSLFKVSHSEYQDINTSHD